MEHSCDWWLLQASPQHTAKEETRSPIWVEVDKKARLLILSTPASLKVFTKNDSKGSLILTSIQWFSLSVNEEHQTLHISYNQLSFITDIAFFFIIKGIVLCLDVDILLHFIYSFLPWNFWRHLSLKRKLTFLLCQYSKSYGYFKCVVSGGLIKSFFGRKKSSAMCVCQFLCCKCSTSGWCQAFNRTSPRQSWE